MEGGRRGGRRTSYVVEIPPARGVAVITSLFGTDYTYICTLGGGGGMGELSMLLGWGGVVYVTGLGGWGELSMLLGWGGVVYVTGLGGWGELSMLLGWGGVVYVTGLGGWGELSGLGSFLLFLLFLYATC